MNGKLLKSLLMVLMITCTSIDYVKSQSIVGAYGNHAGSHGALLNPSSLTTSGVYADFGLNLGLSAYNNYFHVPSADAFKSVFDKSFKMSYTKIINGFPRVFDLDFNYGSSKRATANVGADAVVLSGMYNFRGRHAVGFFARTRANVDVHKFPSEILEVCMVGFDHNYRINDGDPADTTVYYTQYARNYSGKNVNVGIMAWSEFGLSYSTVVFNRFRHRVDLGVNAKVAMSVGAVALSSKKLDYHLELGDSIGMNDSVWFFDRMTGGMAYSLPLGYDTYFTVDGDFNDDLIKNRIAGFGGGIDVGVTYTRLRNSRAEGRLKRNCEISPVDYIWRLGFSVIDLGAVYFGNDAEVSEYDTKNAELNTERFNDVNTVHEFMDVVNEAFDSEIERKGFWMGLPTSLSLQFDYSFNRHFFVNAVVIQPVAITKYHVMRDAQMLLSPRFESQWFDVTMPVTVVNYNRLLLGASFRAAFLTVGTQNLLNLIGVGELYGLDLYVSLKFNFNKGKCLTDRYEDCLKPYHVSKKHGR
ncbi:MAG: DUF5723 family protein [Bacteroidales bacterium]|nr:DUF5723 family protein [Bacteroidales bacterium]